MNTISEYAAVRLGARVAHSISGRTTRREYLTICGRTFSSEHHLLREVDIRDVPLGQHCLKCWG